MSLDASAIILGFTGSIGSGCSYISSMIPRITAGDYQYFKLSILIREVILEEGITNPSIKELQNKGNKLREERGKNFLPAFLLNKLNKDQKKYDKIIIDGIKNEGEVEILRQFPNFYLFSVHADREIRSKRVVDAKLFKNKREFEEADKRDELEEGLYGQQVNRCNDLSDIIILNNKKIPQMADNAKEDFVREIYRRYIKLIENDVFGKYSPEIYPSIDELCMTISYSLSKMSSCLKRKVGAVIVEIEGGDSGKEEKGVVNAVPCIVSSGYNEVPLHSQKCVFHHEYQKCYRDYLQEKHAEGIKFCPSCGGEINLSVECPTCHTKFNRYIKYCQKCRREIKVEYMCPKCKIKIFDVHLPGSKGSPGKLLDMCRSLHAEENAILGLSKRGSSRKDLILYATTQPCNLCANKIVSAGIKKVVFAEPYLMKEAAEILKNGGVELQRFEGIKSSAYFKLYQ